MIRMLWAAIAAALLSASMATAGPIGWGYSTQLSDSFDSPRVTPASGTAVGATTVPLLGVSPFTYGNPLIPGDFTAWFTITDMASGMSHAFAFAGLASYSWDPQFPQPDEALNLFPFGVPQQATIGGHEYTVAQNGAYTGSHGEFVLTAAVTVADTPEPATALLAGIALVCAGLQRIRKYRLAPIHLTKLT